MEYEDDLNVAVSLAATTLTQPENVINSLVNHDESTTDPIFILDAIAHVCSRAIDDNFAVACSVDVAKEEVYLFVSGRSGVDAPTISHLRRIWDLMKEISLYSTESRRMQTRFLDTTALDGTIAEVYAFLSREVYSFGLQGFRARFLYWVEELRKSILKQPIYRLSSVPLFDDFFKLIASIMAIHMSMDYLDLAPGPHEQHLNDFIYRIDSMTRFALDILHTPGLYDTWSRAFRWTDKTVLRKAIQEITYTHRVTHRLLFYAHNPDFPVYHMSLIIIPINSYTPYIPSWPSSTAEWRAIRESVYSRFNYIPGPNRTGYLQKNPLPSQSLVVHPECALIEFLHWASMLLETSFTPPLDHIGMSAPPCAPCDIWIRAYVARTRYAGDYKTRSSSGRWERDCALPRLERRIEQRLAQDVLSYFCVQEAKHGRIGQRFF